MKINSKHWIKGIALFMFLNLFSCHPLKNAGKSNEIQTPPMASITFVTDPFGYKPTIRNFNHHLVPPFKLTRYSMKNIHRPAQIDTIYRFHHKKSELFVYKTQTGSEMFFAGNIYDKKIKFPNGIEVGMPRGAFFNCFTDLKYNNEDTVKISLKSEPNNYKFVFKNDRLVAIKIEIYID